MKAYIVFYIGVFNIQINKVTELFIPVIGEAELNLDGRPGCPLFGPSLPTLQRSWLLLTGGASSLAWPLTGDGGCGTSAWCRLAVWCSRSPLLVLGSVVVVVAPGSCATRLPAPAGLVLPESSVSVRPRWRRRPSPLPPSTPGPGPRAAGTLCRNGKISCSVSRFPSGLAWLRCGGVPPERSVGPVS